MKQYCCILFLFIFTIPVLANYTELKRLGMDAGSDALAGISIYAKGANPVFENPSALGHVLEPQIILTGRGFFDRSIISGAFSIPFESIGCFGIGYINSDLPDIPEAVYDAGGGRLTGNSFKYNEKLLSLSWGSQIFNPSMSIGVSSQFYYQNLANITSFTSVINASFLYDYDSHLQWSIVKQNVLNSAIKWSNGTNESIPNLIKIGISYQKFVQCIDFYSEINMQSAYQNQINYGVSWVIHPQLSILYGGSSFSQYLGLKLEMANLLFSFSYALPNENEFMNQSVFSLGVKL